jgi:two-component system, NarL family, nitrate/nitrite response regulator NarL
VDVGGEDLVESKAISPSNSDFAGPVVLIVDDHQMVAEALQRALGARGFSCHLAVLDSAEAVVDQAIRIAPDLILLDLNLGPIDGLELMRSLRAARQRVLVVTGCEDQRRLAAAVALGSMGWIAKARPFEEILEAAESACKDRPVFAPQSRVQLTTTGRQYVDVENDFRARIAALTPREREVLHAIVCGDNAQAMADRFVVSLGTIRTHIRSVLTKLEVSSQVAAAAVAVEWAASRNGLDRSDLLAPLHLIA